MKTFEESAKSQKTIASLIENPTANNNTKTNNVNTKANNVNTTNANNKPEVDLVPTLQNFFFLRY
jgi:hypothetical protein